MHISVIVYNITPDTRIQCVVAWQRKLDMGKKVIRTWSQRLRDDVVRTASFLLELLLLYVMLWLM